MPRKNRYMDQGIFEKILQELFQYTNELSMVSLHLIGETLLDPLLLTRVAQPKAAGIKRVHFVKGE